MRTEVINKIEITEEAAFDYECCIGRRSQPLWWDLLAVSGDNPAKAFKIAEWFDQPLRKLDKRKLKAETEEYINRMNGGGRLLYENYFRCKWYDEQTGLMLMLFLYRAAKMSVMQYWDLKGICPADDWTEDAEEDGLIRVWIESPITNLNCEYDWVEEMRLRQEIGKIEEELDKIYDKEWKQYKRCEHERRFNPKGTKNAQAQLADIADARKRLESELRISKLRLKGYQSASGAY